MPIDFPPFNNLELFEDLEPVDIDAISREMEELSEMCEIDS